MGGRGADTVARSSGVVSFLVVETQKSNGGSRGCCATRTSVGSWERTSDALQQRRRRGSLPCLFASLLLLSGERTPPSLPSLSIKSSRSAGVSSHCLPGLPSWMENDGAKTTNTTRPQRLLPHLLAAIACAPSDQQSIATIEGLGAAWCQCRHPTLMANPMRVQGGLRARHHPVLGRQRRRPDGWRL